MLVCVWFAAAALAPTAHGESRSAPVVVELRAGMGLSTGGPAQMTSTLRSPLTLAAGARFAVSEAPAASAYARLFAELMGRSAAGGAAGLSLTLPTLPMHVAGGVAAVVVPYTAWGPAVAVGGCFPVAGRLRVCGDAELTLYIGGTDIPDDSAVTQIQLVGGVQFDAM